MAYALWLIPSHNEYATLQALMEFRPPNSNVKDCSKSYPHFAPHITLTTFPDLPPTFSIDNLPIFGGDFKSPVLDYVSWKQGDTFLGTLGLNLSQPSELERLHKAITGYLGTLGIQWKSRGFPHMSLFYVDEPEERVRLLKGLGHYLKQAWPRDENGIPFAQFTGTEVWLVDCTQSVRQWQVVKEKVISSQK